jgi:hypothetical protein
VTGLCHASSKRPEAGAPVIAIVRRRLRHLLLLFENLDAASFAPWMTPDAPRRERDAPTAAAAGQRLEVRGR